MYTYLSVPTIGKLHTQIIYSTFFPCQIKLGKQWFSIQNKTIFSCFILPNVIFFKFSYPLPKYLMRKGKPLQYRSTCLLVRITPLLYFYASTAVIPLYLLVLETTKITNLIFTYLCAKFSLFFNKYQMKLNKISSLFNGSNRKV